MLPNSKQVETNEEDTTGLTSLDRRTCLRLAGTGVASLALGGIGIGALRDAVQPATATSTGGSVIDDFEDQDLAGWSGSTDEYSFAGSTTVPVPHGSWVLQADPGTFSSVISSTSGLPAYPSKGDRFRAYFRTPDATASISMFQGFGYVDLDNTYKAKLRWGADKLELISTTGGVGTIIASTSVAWASNQWYALTVTWDDGTLGGADNDITIDVDEYDPATDGYTHLTEIGANDATHATNTGVFLSAYTPDGITQYVDHFHLLDEPQTKAVVIDDFEDQDLSEYTGDTGAFSFTTTASQGMYALDSGQSGTGQEIVSTSGLPAYPTRGDIFQFDVRPVDSTEVCSVFFFLEDSNNKYWLRMEPADDELRLRNIVSGSSSTLDSNFDISYSIDDWNTIEVDTSDTTNNTITATVYDAGGTEQGSVTADNSDHDGTGIEIGHNGTASTARSLWDNFSIQGAAGGTTVLETFEDGGISEYTGDTSAFTVQTSTVLKGSYSLAGTSPDGRISTSSIPTPRGFEYRCRVLADTGSGAKSGLIVGDQDTATPHTDAYLLLSNSVDNRLELIRRDASSDVMLDSVDVTIDEGTEYELSIELLTHAIRGVLYDATGTELAATTALPDTTYSGGYLGFYTGAGQPAYFDYVTKRVPQWYNCER